MVIFALCAAIGALLLFVLFRKKSTSEPAPTSAAPKPSPAQAVMMGLRTPGDEKFPVPRRDWNGMKLALWRSRTGWLIAARQADETVKRCAHMEGCAGKTDETAPCLKDCPDREHRMSALVILNAARQFAPVTARQLTNEPYYAPSRERYSEVIAELAACQAELEAGSRAEAPPNVETPELKQPPVKIPQNIIDDEGEPPQLPEHA